MDTEEEVGSMSPSRRIAFRSAAREARYRVLRSLGGQRRRSLSERPEGAAGTVSSERINELLALSGGKSYLEVGVADGTTLEAVKAQTRVGVDPWPVFDADHLPEGVRFLRKLSDEFFADLPFDVTFDAVFLDGLHEFQQTYRDLMGALEHLSPAGFVLIDDTVPADSVAALPEQRESIRLARELGMSFPRPWMGDVYKVVYMLACNHPELTYFTYAESGHSQTIVWPSRTTGRSADPSERAQLVQTPDYSSAWLATLPEWFHPAAPAMILDAFGSHCVKGAPRDDGNR